MTDQITVNDQRLRDENYLKLGKKKSSNHHKDLSGKKIKNITKIDDHTWKVFDDYGGNFFRATYRTVEVHNNNKIHCDIICSQFKWERNRHPNCEHVQAVMHFENKKFKTYIPIEWEIVFLNSRLRTKNMTANYLKESIAQKELKLKQIAKSILKIEKEVQKMLVSPHVNLIKLKELENNEY